jgi:hypothetical protein
MAQITVAQCRPIRHQLVADPEHRSRRCITLPNGYFAAKTAAPPAKMMLDIADNFRNFAVPDSTVKNAVDA